MLSSDHLSEPGEWLGLIIISLNGNSVGDRML